MLVANGPHASSPESPLHKHCGYPPLQFPALVQYSAMGCEATGAQVAFAAAFQDSGQSVAPTLLSCNKQSLGKVSFVRNMCVMKNMIMVVAK